MTILRIATRKSKLALWQTHFVKAALEARYPTLEVVLVEMLTEGDLFSARSQQTSSLIENDSGGKAMFVKALQSALLENKADIAVHSMKDMSVFPVAGLTIGAVLARADARDAYVSQQYPNIADLPEGAVIGTASPRRSALCRALYPHVAVKILRGNVDTRLSKLKSGEYDAIILACAGLDRLGLSDDIKVRLPEDDFVPAIAQGAIAVECRSTDSATLSYLAFLQDAKTALCVEAERAVNRVLGGDCYTPVGAHAKIMDDQLQLCAMLSIGDVVHYESAVAHLDQAVLLGERIGAALKRKQCES